ncbi:MAG: hypothetical protein V2I33_01575 [Kangiellaceae bacterium]|jgi:hypothetical protein|nr:hypothetical protein [Kangiellaceae bacterium]
MDAYKALLAGREKHFDSALVTKFINWRGVYPAGSIVELSNGEVGIVTKINPEQKLRPQVMIMLNEFKEPIPQGRMIDLAVSKNDFAGRPIQIIHSLPNNSHGINLKDCVDNAFSMQQDVVIGETR